MRNFSFVIVCVCAASVLNVAAGKTKSKSMPEIAWDQSSFNIDSDNVGEDYSGHSCEKAFNALTVINLEKGEFEDNGSYDERISVLSSGKLYGDVSINSTLGLMAKKLEGMEINSSYNADKKILTIGTPTTLARSRIKPVTESDNYYTMIPVENVKEKREKYFASNSFGVKTSVEKTTYSACWAIIENYSITKSLSVSISDVEPDVARSLKNNVDVIYVGTLTRPFKAIINHRWTPTLTEPFEKIYSGPAVVFNLNETWVIERSTGKVIYKKRR